MTANTVSEWFTYNYNSSVASLRDEIRTARQALSQATSVSDSDVTRLQNVIDDIEQAAETLESASNADAARRDEQYRDAVDTLAEVELDAFDVADQHEDLTPLFGLHATVIGVLNKMPR